VLTGKVFTVDDAVAIIDRITAEELRTLALDLFAGDRMRLAVVGPLSKDEPLGDLLKV
jgi:predicted Zn-dependent peptidase